MKFTALVSADQLTRHLHDPQWVVFDCRFALTRTESGRQADQARAASARKAAVAEIIKQV